MERLIKQSVLEDLKRKIVIISGPRQVGKTTLAKNLVPDCEYLNFDIESHRRILMKREWNRHTKLIIFDELHKLKKWKLWLKGIYDEEGVRTPILVTGSARMDLLRKVGDSLAGRHLSFRLHPFTVKELKGQLPAEECLERLLRHGGFPEPFLADSDRIAKRWRQSHLDVILRQDLLDLEAVRDIKSIEILISLLSERVGQIISYQSLANDLHVSIHTVKHWLEILERLYVLFRVSPYSRSIAGALRKESKYFFYDTGKVSGDAARLENCVACALKAELDYREDQEGDSLKLHFVRNKQKQEVDFLVVVNGKATTLIEVKQSDNNFSAALFRFRAQLGTIKAYQVVHQLDREREKDQVRMVQLTKFLETMPIG